MQKVKLAGYLGDGAPSPAITGRPGTYVIPKHGVCHHKPAFLWIIFVLPAFAGRLIPGAQRLVDRLEPKGVCFIHSKLIHAFPAPSCTVQVCILPHSFRFTSPGWDFGV